jgi:hypothetical protein
MSYRSHRPVFTPVGVFPQCPQGGQRSLATTPDLIPGAGPFAMPVFTVINGKLVAWHGIAWRDNDVAEDERRVTIELPGITVKVSDDPLVERFVAQSSGPSERACSLYMEARTGITLICVTPSLS